MSHLQLNIKQLFTPLHLPSQSLVSGKDMAQKRHKQFVATKTQKVLKPQLANINGGKKAIRIFPTSEFLTSPKKNGFFGSGWKIPQQIGTREN